jgi:hypothetical protein
MKRLILLGLFGIMGLMPYKAEAQININVNIGSQPLWGPVGYNYVNYYYLPEIETYYHVSNRQFIYLSGSRWIFSSSLPSRYRGYDLYRGYKVVVNSHEPYRNFHSDRERYSRYRSVHNQPVIRHSNDSRYYVIKGHPYHGRSSSGHYDKHDSRDYDRGHDRDRDKHYSDRDKGRGGDKKHDKSRGHGRGKD